MSGGVDSAVAALLCARGGETRRRHPRAVGRPRQRRRALVLLGRGRARRPRAGPRHGPAAPHARPARGVPRRRRGAVPRRPRGRPDAEPVRALQRPRAPRRDARARRRGSAPTRWPPATTRAWPATATARCCASRPTRPRTRATCSPRCRPATLARLRFPLGELDKPQVRELAARGRTARSPTSPTPRTCASSPAPTARRSSPATAGSSRAPARSSTARGARGRTPPRPSRLHGRPAPRPRRGGAGEPLYVLAKDAADQPRRGRPARGAAAHARAPSATRRCTATARAWTA